MLEYCPMHASYQSLCFGGIIEKLDKNFGRNFKVKIFATTSYLQLFHETAEIFIVKL